MEDLKKVGNIEGRIETLRQRLDDIVCTKSLDSETILELSRQLDVLIVDYYNQKNTQHLHL